MEMNTLDELERLLAATQGEEWRVSNRDPVRVVDGTGAYIALCDPHHKGDPLQETRAALIVAAINALPGLLESARRVEEMQAALKPFAVFSECFTDVSHDDAVGARFSTTTISVGAFRHASAALKGT
jgi:hypothetical protein